MIVLALLLSAFAVGLDNFAAAIGIGVAGVDARTRVRVAAVFGLFEVAMPVVGLLIGHGSADTLGTATRYVGGGLLGAAGIWVLAEARRDGAGSEHGDQGDGNHERDTAAQRLGQRTGPLLVTAFALSIDNLVVGFGLGVTKTPLIASLLVFALVSVGLSLAGLELGRTLGVRMKDRAEWIAGAVLLAVGALIAGRIL